MFTIIPNMFFNTTSLLYLHISDNICQEAPAMPDASVEVFPLYVMYHCDPGFAFADGRVSMPIKCPCRQTWEALSGQSCKGIYALIYQYQSKTFDYHADHCNYDVPDSFI